MQLAVMEAGEQQEPMAITRSDLRFKFYAERPGALSVDTENYVHTVHTARARTESTKGIVPSSSFRDASTSYKVDLDRSSYLLVQGDEPTRPIYSCIVSLFRGN